MTALSTINPEQRLYVVPCGKGYSCLGFDVAERHICNFESFLGLPHVAMELGTIEHYRLYESLQRRACEHATATRTRCELDLSPQLKGLEGHRVEVVDIWPDSKPRRFIVGKSTGWYPIHLEIARRDSHGGGGALRKYKSVRDLGKVYS